MVYNKGERGDKMTIYTQQINNMVEQLPISEQRYIAELIEKISINHLNGTKKSSNTKMSNQKEAVNRFIKTLNSVEPLADDELDEILIKGISLRTPEELDIL